MKKLLALLLAIVMILSLAACGGSSDDDDEDEEGGGAATGSEGYITAIENCLYGEAGLATKAQVKSMYPAEGWEYYEEVEGMSFADFWEMYNENHEGAQEELEEEYGKNLEITVKSTGKEEWAEEDVDALKQYLSEEYGIKESNVKKVYAVDFKATITGSEDSETIEEASWDVMQIGNAWYIVDLFYWGYEGDDDYYDDYYNEYDEYYETYSDYYESYSDYYGY